MSARSRLETAVLSDNQVPGVGTPARRCQLLGGALVVVAGVDAVGHAAALIKPKRRCRFSEGAGWHALAPGAWPSAPTPRRHMKITARNCAPIRSVNAS